MRQRGRESSGGWGYKGVIRRRRSYSCVEQNPREQGGWVIVTTTEAARLAVATLLSAHVETEVPTVNAPFLRSPVFTSPAKTS